jgi:S1-C subfamily serine protease
MNAKLRQLYRIRPAQRLLIASTLLLTLLPVGLWLVKKARSPQSPQFEQAYELALQLNQPPSSYMNLLSRSGIGQLDYDRWRQLNGKPIADIDQIRPEEVKAIYQEQWQKGNCAQYDTPLDLTCLDSLISFGDIQGKQLLNDLPSDPAQAAMAVVERRELARRRQIRPPLTSSNRLALREGIRRDQALADLIAKLPNPTLPNPTSPFQPPVASPTALPQTGKARSAGQIYMALQPSTVEIEDRSRRGSASTAAGVIVTAEGLVVTNYHVVESDSFPQVKLADGQQFVGRVILVDEVLDLALIQLQGAAGLPMAPLAASSAQVQVGDPVYAIGSPFGQSWKMSQSQVIELNSICANGRSPLRCIRTPSGFLQPGNSGGPLIDATAQVIGINRAVQQSTGEGVSIPIETVKEFLARRSGQPSPAVRSPAVPSPAVPSRPSRNPPRQWL